eukprot:3316765-Rhodomonas_salina.5
MVLPVDRRGMTALMEASKRGSAASCTAVVCTGLCVVRLSFVLDRGLATLVLIETGARDMRILSWY